MPLIKRAAAHFKRGDRQRGAEYYRAGRVGLTVDDALAKASVKGNERQSYAVGIDWSRVESKRVAHVFCECRRFAQTGACKHLWATLMALADETPSSQHPPGEEPVSLAKDDRRRWEELGLALGDEDAPDRPTPRVHNARPSRKGPRGDYKRPTSPEAAWRDRLEPLRQEVRELAAAAAANLDVGEGKDRVLRFVVNTAASEAAGGLVLDVFESPDGGKPKPASVDPDELAARLSPPRASRNGDGDAGHEDAADDAATDEPPATPRAATPQPAAPQPAAPQPAAPLPLITTLPGESRGHPQARNRRGAKKSGPPRPPVRPARVRRLLLPQALYDSVLPHLAAEGNLGWWDGHSPKLRQVRWDDGAPWELALRLDVAGHEGVTRLRGALERPGERVPLSVSEAILPPPRPGPSTAAVGSPVLVLFEDRLARLDSVPRRDYPWLVLLGGDEEIVIPKRDVEEALTSLLELPALPRLEMPDDLQLEEERSPMRPRLVLGSATGPTYSKLPLRAALSFVYGALEVNAGDTRAAVVDWEKRVFLRRDMEGEQKALLRLVELGLRPVSSQGGHGLELDPENVPTVAEPLLFEGWEVEVHGTSLRPPGPPSLKVESGMDWFELSGGMDFAGEHVDLAAAMAASARGERFVKLKDGSQGLLPASWIETYDSLSKLSHDGPEGGLRFLPSQAMLVDALLAAMPPADVDKPFAELREKLRTLDRIKPKKELASFDGTLRGYQREGLGWLTFLRDFGLGGVLADDMGLGKTVQVLALIQAHRTPKKSSKLPFLVVAPRSLVYNWIEEAKRFTPKLSVLEYTGADREELQDQITEHDVVITTYGTLRRDVAYLVTVEFDTVILDEAQTIKNRDSQAAKASRLLVAQHRLALTGTPIENHLGELGSIFEFLNPGLFGRLPRLDALSGGRQPSQQEIALVAQGMRPFILRRTKAQVLPDLPPRTELTIHCNLRPEQRALYDKLRARYQASLLQQVEGKGMAGSSLQVLEALLRLRQVACHPGLVDADWEEAGSAKLEALFAHVSEVLDEGHKVIVFSQFTQLLAYVKSDLDAQGVPYAYLDGSTRDRGEVVERFQTDPACNVFLISIKAGGVGLNLTAAGYVFLLDPWWNPAVEAQAIDRAHRIGQTQPVFAYRLIASDTVEEKILELQRSKRELADAILEGPRAVPSELTADDLRMLLS